MLMHWERHALPGDTFISPVCMDCDAEVQAKQATIDLKVMKAKWARDDLALPVDTLHLELDIANMALDIFRRSRMTGRDLRVGIPPPNARVQPTCRGRRAG